VLVVLGLLAISAAAVFLLVGWYAMLARISRRLESR
jgi:hypothetical protein